MTILSIIEHYCGEEQAGRLRSRCQAPNIDGAMIDMTPEFHAALALLGYRRANDASLPIDEACKIGARAWSDDEIDFDTLRATLQEVFGAIEDYGDAIGEAAKWN